MKQFIQFKSLVILVYGLCLFCIQSCDTATTPTGDQPLASSKMELAKNWHIVSADGLESDGTEISQVSFDPAGWHEATMPSTVLATLVNNGVYKDIFYGKRMAELPELWKQEWWYRTEFEAPEQTEGKQYFLKFTGINYKADIYLNGKLIADTNQVAGAFRVYEFNVSDGILPGQTNALALKITPPKNVGYEGVELTFSYVD